MDDQTKPEGKQIIKEDVEGWFAEHADGLYRFALLRVSDTGKAEDLVQETFLAALKSWKTFKGQSSVRSWLLGIMKHKVVDHYRKEGRHKALKEELESGNNISGQFGFLCWAKGFGPKRWDNDPQETHLNNKFLKVLKECLDKLTDIQREIFILREVEEYTTKEIQGITELKPNHIRVTLYRSRIFLRSCIEKLWINISPEGKRGQ